MPHGGVILAASLGTGFEWYDFFLYGALAATISREFFAGVNQTSAFIFALLAFAAGFAVRDLVGRKKTFLATIIIMGAATTLVGVLPNYQSVGIAAPVMLIALRMLQGLAIGGESARINYPMVLLMILILVVYVTLVTAPMAAWLVELFPARVRYTSLSVPYHIGAGWFGGFMPAVAFTLVAITGDIYSWLWYPVIVAAVTVVAGVCLLPETAGPHITGSDSLPGPSAASSAGRVGE